MEKSSEKIIGTNKLQANPFNNLLSEVQIKINQPKSSKKIENYALQIDSNIDRSCSNMSEQVHNPSKKQNHFEGNSKITHHNVYVINAPMKTKNSSDTLSKHKTQKEIIDQWIVGYMSKRHILGIHWEENLATKTKQLLEVAFNKIKSAKPQSAKEDPTQKKMSKFADLINKIERSYVKQSFGVLKEFYKDDLLFGLSNTMGDEKDNSLMLRIDSDYEALSVQSKNFKKPNKRPQQFSFSDHSQSNKNETKKISESCSASQDLSNLILNHNKLKIEDELNKSAPNIPKDKNSQKIIKTHKQIADLDLETKKHIPTQKKLTSDQKPNELPLQSNKNLIHTKKEVEQADSKKKINEKQEEQNQPITITFILNNMNSSSLLKADKENNLKQKGQSMFKKNEPQNNAYSDQNIINRLPITESFYQHADKKTPPITFGKLENQKRSTSLQIKPGYAPLFPQKAENHENSGSVKRIQPNQYYPEDSNRDCNRFMRINIDNTNEKARPKSATPKITFTFTSAPNRTADMVLSGASSNANQYRVPIHHAVQLPRYEHQDFIIESILSSQNQFTKPILSNERMKHNKLQVISPSRKAQSPKRLHPPNKIALDNRQHIKNNILPPAFNDYGADLKGQGQKMLKSQKSNGKLVVLENEIIYSDNLQISTAHNSLFACSSRESNLNNQNKQQYRVQSPKDKIFVTYGNRCNF